jgi:proliferating cell nuclear antigen
MDQQSDLLFELKTVQATALRSLIELCKEWLTDVNLSVTPGVGIKLITMDSSKVSMIHCELDAVNFESFVCVKPLVLGVNMTSLFKLIKSVTSSDVLCMYVHSANKHELGIRIDSAERKSSTKYSLKLLDIDEDPISVPRLKMDSTISLSAVDFQRLMRDMSAIGSSCRFRLNGSCLMLSCAGDFATQETTLQMNNEEVEGEGNKDLVIDNTYALRYLNLFSKSSSLCGQVTLCLRQSFPLLMIFSVASLGRLRFLLAPKVNDL